jgi:SAM-dependent methyltransferase
VTSLLMSYFEGVASVTGVDVDPDSIEFANRYIAPLRDGLTFLTARRDAIDLPDNAFDLIVVNQVFCNMYRAEYEVMVSELSRMLKTDGRLLLADSNNPHNEAVRSSLLALYDQLENPESGSYVRIRQGLVAAVDATLPAREIALRTCYMDRAEIQRAVEHYRQTGELPNSFYERETLRVPRAFGVSAFSSPTDPQFFIDEFRRHNIECVASHYYPVGAGMTPAQLATSGSFYLVRAPDGHA